LIPKKNTRKENAMHIVSPTKFAVAPEFAEARASMCGVAVFVATFIALGIIASLTAGLDVRSVMALDDAPPTYAQVQTSQ
jgi:hypothetical protein